MRKFLVSLLMLVMILILIIPLLMGFLVANEFKKQLDHFNYPDVKVQLISYHTGWFTSQVKLKIDQQTPAILRRLPIINNKPIEHLTYLANLRIYHGPVALAQTLNKHHRLFWGQSAISGELRLIEPQLSVLTELQGLDSPVRLFAILTTTGNLKLGFQHDAIKYTNTDQGMMLNLGATVSHLSIDRRSPGEISGTFDMQGLQFAHKATEIYIAPYHSTFVSHRIQNSWSGESQSHTSEIDILFEGHQIAKLFDVSLWTHKTLMNDKITIQQVMTINKMQAMDSDFNQLRSELVIQNLNFSSLSKIRKLLGGSLLLEDQPRRKALLDSIPPLLNGVQLQLKILQAQTPIGLMQASGTWQISSANLGRPNLPFLMQIGKGRLNLNLPAPHNEAAFMAGIISAPGPVLPSGTKTQNQQVNMLNVLLYSAYNKGYLKKQGDRLVAILQFDNGKLIVDKS